MTEPIDIDEDIADLLPRFASNRMRDVQSLVEHLNNQDFAAARRLGHQLKGSGASYGFPGISQRGAAIEAAAKAEDLDAARAEVKALDLLLDAIAVRMPNGVVPFRQLAED